MGKASRRARKNDQSAPKVIPAPFVARPFEGLPGETDWVAMRQIVPAATATVRLRTDAPAVEQAVAEAPSDVSTPSEVTIATVLPMAWPGLRRDTGELLVGLQSIQGGGDVSRDVADVILQLLATAPGSPVTQVRRTVMDSPRLQDVLDLSAPFDVRVHEGFDFWVAEGTELDDAAKASLQQADESIIPTTRLESIPSAYWCRVGDRTHLRWMLPHDEDAATNALARLHAAGELSLGEGTRFLGAFRADGLLAPVWDLDPALEADAYESAAEQMAQRFATAMESSESLNADERRAKAGVLSRQLTLR